ncbi:MAG: hypothetical protein ABF243_11845 [Celeribacter marinus]
MVGKFIVVAALAVGLTACAPAYVAGKTLKTGVKATTKVTQSAVGVVF